MVCSNRPTVCCSLIAIGPAWESSSNAPMQRGSASDRFHVMTSPRHFEGMDTVTPVELSHQLDDNAPGTGR